MNGNIVVNHQYSIISPDGPKEQAEQAINDLRNTVQEAINKGVKTLEDIKANLIATFDKMKQQVIDNAKTQMDQIIATYQAEIDSWKKKADALGVNVQDCLGQTAQQLKDLPKFALNKMLSCITDEYNTAMSIINNAEDIIKSTIKKVDEIITKFKNCSGVLAIPCYISVAVKCASLTISLVADITKEVADVTSFITGLQARLQLCAATQVAAVAAQAGTIAKNTVECIIKKISGKNLIDHMY